MTIGLYPKEKIGFDSIVSICPANRLNTLITDWDSSEQDLSLFDKLGIKVIVVDNPEWGLEKDLFLPFKEQTRKVKEGDRFPVALYVDKSGRLCATMKVYHYLRTDSPYHKDDRVSGCLYEISRQFGAFVAVDNQYSALIPPKEMYGELKVGDHVEARVVRVHEDGKLDLSVREKAYLQIETDVEKVMKLIDSFDGVLPFTDKASPEVIRRELAMSKNEFKRAVGNLLKNGRIEITEKAIRRI